MEQTVDIAFCFHQNKYVISRLLSENLLTILYSISNWFDDKKKTVGFNENIECCGRLSVFKIYYI